jgi:hypothetical protein
MVCQPDQTGRSQVYRILFSADIALFPQGGNALLRSTDVQSGTVPHATFVAAVAEFKTFNRSLSCDAFFML